MSEKKARATLLLGAAILGLVANTGCGAADDSHEEVGMQTENLSFNNTLLANWGLWPGDSLVSDNGLYRLTMQTDCNLVLYALDTNGWSNPPIAVWSSNTWNKGTNCNAMMQTDGNFVVYTNNGTKALWHSGTWGRPGAYLELQDDRNLVIYDRNRRALWSSNTWLPQPPVPQP